MILGTVAAYAWIFTTFVTHADLGNHTQKTDHVVDARVTQLASDFHSHVEATTIWQLETRLEDISDKRWSLKERMEAPDGNTRDNRDKDRELQKRESKLNKEISCLQQSGKHCLTDPA